MVASIAIETYAFSSKLEGIGASLGRPMPAMMGGCGGGGGAACACARLLRVAGVLDSNSLSLGRVQSRFKSRSYIGLVKRAMLVD
jgi:hypothetical protein